MNEKNINVFIDFGSSLFLNDVVNGEKEFVSMCGDLNKIISSKIPNLKFFNSLISKKIDKNEIVKNISKDLLENNYIISSPHSILCISLVDFNILYFSH